MFSRGVKLAGLSGIGAAFAVMVSAGMASSVQAAPFVIDDFSLPLDGSHITQACPAAFTTGLCSGISNTSSVTNFIDGGATGAIWGNTRNVNLTNVAGSTNTPSTVAISSSALGTLGYSNADGNTSTLILEYNGTAGFQGDGSSANAAVNFLAFGDSFHIVIQSLDLTIAARIELWDADGTEVQHDFTKEGTSGGAVFPFDHYVGLEIGAGKFTNEGGGNGTFDFSQVVAVNITAFGIPQGSGSGQGVDLTLDLIEVVAVPEPTTISMMGMALVGMGVARRRRKAAA